MTSRNTCIDSHLEWRIMPCVVETCYPDSFSDRMVGELRFHWVIEQKLPFAAHRKMSKECHSAQFGTPLYLTLHKENNGAVFWRVMFVRNLLSKPRERWRLGRNGKCWNRQHMYVKGQKRRLAGTWQTFTEVCGTLHTLIGHRKQFDGLSFTCRIPHYGIVRTLYGN